MSERRTFLMIITVALITNSSNIVMLKISIVIEQKVDLVDWAIINLV